ncbi:BOP1NT-domain-containing protein [Auricularia subglabra TFB-10046 SS5]|nr:BOP1NT-domain-containing protein [Auricularia subglabra TFB-10046 SS5]
MTASKSLKRKAPADDAPAAEHALINGNGIDMASDSEDEDFVPGEGSSDSEDEFPEIDTRSDSGSEELVDEDTDDDDASLSSATLHVGPQSKTIISDITGRPKVVYPEIDPDYDSDSSTEDDPNRVGNVPMHWYDDMPHIGYSMDGKKVFRPAKGDELDKFLATVDDPESWTSAFDKSLQSDKPLTPEELDIIRRLQAGENPDADYDPYEPTIEWFTGKGKEEVMPLSAAPEPKRRWVPSKWEKKKILKIVKAIREGRIIPNKPKTASKQPQFYDIWGAPSDSQPPLPAPKVKLPTNAESYNPPAEYLPSEEEKQAWEEADKEDREREFLPKKYSALRLVPAYDQFIQERFSRQLDLYLAPRIQRKKLNIDPNSLIPQLPSPSSLKPFPCYRASRVSHSDRRVRAVSVSPDGLWVVSADEGGKVSLWETLVGRPVKVWQFKSKVGAVEWCPRKDVIFFVVALEEELHFLSPPNLPASIANLTHALLSPSVAPESKSATPSPIKWRAAETGVLADDERPLLTVELPQSSGLVKQIAWHRRGDYFATLSATESHTTVWIHQTSKRHSQAPFKKIKGSLQRVCFHPLKPHFFVATQRYVRIYDLSAQSLIKTLTPGIRWISSMDIHPSGDHLIVGGYDRKLCWFDLDLSSKPYKVLRYHARAIRAVQFHPVYPLFASSSDDGTVQVFHARVFTDLMSDPLIVPLKVLRGHSTKEGLGVLEVKWNPAHPWLVSAGADGTAAVWCA